MSTPSIVVVKYFFMRTSMSISTETYTQVPVMNVVGNLQSRGDHGSAPLVVLVGVRAAPAMTVEAHTGVAVPVALVADEGGGSCWTCSLSYLSASPLLLCLPWQAFLKTRKTLTDLLPPCALVGSWCFPGRACRYLCSAVEGWSFPWHQFSIEKVLGNPAILHATDITKVMPSLSRTALCETLSFQEMPRIRLGQRMWKLDMWICSEFQPIVVCTVTG